MMWNELRGQIASLLRRSMVCGLSEKRASSLSTLSCRGEECVEEDIVRAAGAPLKRLDTDFGKTVGAAGTEDVFLAFWTG